MTDEAEARAALASIPGLAPWPGQLQRLGGLTNVVFQAGAVCLRLPGKGTEEYIDRANEAVAARAAAEAGVSPEVLHADPATGILVTRFIAGATTMTPDLFSSTPGAPPVLARSSAGCTVPARCSRSASSCSP